MLKTNKHHTTTDHSGIVAEQEINNGSGTTEIPPTILCGTEGLPIESLEAIIVANDADVVATLADENIETYRFEVTITGSNGKSITQVYLDNISLDMISALPPALGNLAVEAVMEFARQRRHERHALWQNSRTPEDLAADEECAKELAKMTERFKARLAMLLAEENSPK